MPQPEVCGEHNEVLKLTCNREPGHPDGYHWTETPSGVQIWGYTRLSEENTGRLRNRGRPPAGSARYS